MQKRLHRTVASLLCATAAAWTVPAQAGDQVVNFHIAAGDLGTSLRTFGLQSGEQILFQEEMVRGRRAGGLSGSYHTTEALNALLRESGLVAVRTSDGVMVLKRAAPQPARRISAAYAPQQVSSAGSGSAAAPEEPPPGEIIVTATRSSELLSKVPISIAAVTQEQIEAKGLKEFSDIVKLTPGIAVGGNNLIAIRGVASSAGAATTGVYLDDVPIQVRQVGYTASNIFPSLFDLERVEVLRGPQGTLFGAGSQGGTVRFIQPAPNFDHFDGHARVDISTIRGGGMGYEAGAAVGGPLVVDKLAFRASGYFRHTPGWIDRVVGQARVVDPTLPPTRTDAMTFDITDTPYKNSNWSETKAGRAALAFRPTDEFTATLSVNYERNYEHDRGGSVWMSISDPGAGEFRNPLFLSEPAGTVINVPGVGGVELTEMEAPDLNTGRNKMLIPYLNLEWANDTFEVISTTSLLDRDSDRWSSGLSYLYSYARIPVAPPGFRSASLYNDWQNNFTQEVRVQSVNRDNPLTWLFGAFYTRNRQGSIESIYSNFMRNVPKQFGDAPDSPFPGAGTFLNTYGVEPGPNSLIYLSRTWMRETQFAVFGQLDYKITPELTFSAGLRWASNKLYGNVFQDGPENNLNAPYGSDCNTPGGCTPGEGEWTPEFVRDTMKSKEKILNPKFNLSWQANPDTLLYVQAAKGFRPGGLQERLPSVCNEQLELFGYVDDSGNIVSPTSYDSDSVWSYEAGTKTRLMNGLLSVDGSVYMIKWSDIQSRITLPDCGYALNDNMGTATSKGFDLAVNLRPLDGLDLSAAVGYNKTAFDETTPAFEKGDFVPSAGPPWVVRLSYDYSHELSNNVEIYTRGDYIYNSQPRLTGSVNPNSPSYQPLDGASPATEIINARIGAVFGAIDVSLYANNLLNSHKSLGQNYTRRTVLFTSSYERPRTIGLSASFRY